MMALTFIAFVAGGFLAGLEASSPGVLALMVEAWANIFHNLEQDTLNNIQLEITRLKGTMT